MTLISHYIVRREHDEATDARRPFTEAHAAAVGLPAESITEDGGLPHGSALRLITAWNREQARAGSDISYHLPE